MNYRKGVFVVVYSFDDKSNQIFYLLLKRKLHWKGWEFPKGGVESREIDEETIYREVLEETGQKAKEIHNFKIFSKYKYPKKLLDRPEFDGQTYHLYSCRITKKDIKYDKLEHSDFRWLNYENAIKTLTWPNQRRCLRIVNKFLNEKYEKK
jgi:8-oxo-dGTP pyrophosphatase MutT (NUDIX family)